MSAPPSPNHQTNVIELAREQVPSSIPVGIACQNIPVLSTRDAPAAIPSACLRLVSTASVARPRVLYTIVGKMTNCSG